MNTDPEYSAGYRFDIVSQEYSSEYGNGVIISQEPEAGTTTSEEKKDHQPGGEQRARDGGDAEHCGVHP